MIILESDTWCQFVYTPYEGLYLTNQKSRKLGVFVRKLKGSHSPFYDYFDKYYRKCNDNVHMMSSSYELIYIRIIMHNIENITQEATLKTNMVEPA